MANAKVIPIRGRAPQQGGGAYVLGVTLSEVKPPVWRRLRVAGDLTVRDLHHVLQIAMGWDDCHLHEFDIEGKRYGLPYPPEERGRAPLDEQDYRIASLLRRGTRFGYLYDFGDAWRHEIVVEDTVAGEPGVPKAQCLDGARACPPEDCHGALGYGDLLAVLARPTKRSAELREWVGPDFDPEKFELDVVNRELRGAGTAVWRRKRERFYAQ
jgi:hypothetical protein